MSDRARATCTGCHREHALTAAGLIRRHSRSGRACPGSGLAPAEGVSPAVARAAAAVRAHQWGEPGWSAHDNHTFHHECAVCTGDVAALLAVAESHLRSSVTCGTVWVKVASAEGGRCSLGWPHEGDHLDESSGRTFPQFTFQVPDFAPGGVVSAPPDDAGELYEVPVIHRSTGEPVVLEPIADCNDGQRFRWDPRVPPGGWVCAEPDPDRPDRQCGYPVESEPCDRHGSSSQREGRTDA